MAKAIDEARSFHSQEATTKLDDFEAIYREHYAPIWRFLLHLGVRESDVPDVTHNVFLIAHRKLGEFEQRSSLRTWLCGIALRVGRDFMRSAAVRLEVAASDALTADSAAGDDSSEKLLQKRQLALAIRLLESLPAEQREVFVLHELEQMTGPEIAELMGTSVNTVRSRLNRARDSFRARLAELRKEGALDV
ncbi:MAG TPA: RNA polymerase sigma factor [Polyangiaceae bacterium]|nr:RNA polymerase sigma factor [Polyangiaceae bacterium]